MDSGNPHTELAILRWNVVDVVSESELRIMVAETVDGRQAYCDFVD